MKPAKPKKRDQRKIQDLADLFSYLQKQPNLPTPTIYGTPLWLSASTMATPEMQINAETEEVSVKLPERRRRIRLPIFEFIQVLCLSSCEKHSERFFNQELPFWSEKYPWIELQAHQLKACRSRPTVKQLEIINQFASVLIDQGYEPPDITFLKYGWAWMFEAAPGTWPAAEYINPRSSLFDPYLGILCFQDIFHFLQKQGFPENQVWIHEMALCFAAYCISQHPAAFSLKSAQIQQEHSSLTFQIILSVTAPLQAYAGSLAHLLTEHAFQKSNQTLLTAIFLQARALLVETCLTTDAISAEESDLLTRFLASAPH